MVKKISLAEIAKSLGVSKTLVSLVINNKADEHGISVETQQRVREKIKELNYQPDELAQGLRTGRTKTIGLIVSDISNLFYSKLARRIEDYAWLSGYTVVICSTDEDISKELEQIRMLRSRKIDGLIVSSSQKDATFFDKLADENYPHVLIDRIFTEMHSPNVSVDNFGGARMAARHLISQGIRNFCVISITPEHISTINERLKGFESALNEMGIKIPEEWHIRAPFHQIDQAVKEGIQRIYQSAHLPDAIFTLNNNLTSATLKYLRKLSVRIPEEVALIGFDDLVYFSYTHPSISAIEQPIDRIGEKSFELLLRQIQKEQILPHERSIYLPVDIIIRESSIKNQNT